MNETPRARLKSLMDGLELPKGFKLTPARESALRELGRLLVKNGKLKCYGPTVNFRNIMGRYAINMSMSAKAALRGMCKAKWVKTVAERPEYVNRWAQHIVEFQPGLEQLALRLAARQMLWEERKQAPIENAREAYESVRNQLGEARRTLNKVSYDPLVGENDVLETVKKLRALTAEVSEAERRLQEAKNVVQNVPEPTEDEAFAWLMERRLRGTHD